MTGFVSLPPPTTDPQQLVENDGWYPDVDLVQLRASVRIDTTVTLERLREATVAAMIAVRADLAPWRADQEAAGATGLATVEAPQIGGESTLLALYRRAVASMAAADLAERLRDVGTTNSGHDRADELECAADTHHRNARWAIRDILGQARSTVELL